MKKLWQDLSPILLWGSLWGITEATIGYGLHLLPIGIGFMVWYPMAFYFMHKVYRQTGKPSAILTIAVMSAVLKLTDLFMPVRIDYVLNPAVSILLEGLALYALIRLKLPNLVFCANTLWRGLYFLYIAVMPAWMVALSPLRGWPPLLEFMLLHNLLTSALIGLCLYIASKVKLRQRTLRLSPVAILFILSLNLLCQWFIF